MDNLDFSESAKSRNYSCPRARHSHTNGCSRSLSAPSTSARSVSQVAATSCVAASVALQVDHYTGAITRTQVLSHSVQLSVPLRGPHKSKGHDARCCSSICSSRAPFSITMLRYSWSLESAGFYIASQKRWLDTVLLVVLLPPRHSVETWRLEVGKGQRLSLSSHLRERGGSWRDSSAE